MNHRPSQFLRLLFAGIACLLIVPPSLCEEAPALPWVKGSTTLVVIPDTEVYAAKRPHIFNAMMKWVAENREARSIACCLHVGDVTNNNTKREWQNARAAFDLIEGKVPYVLAAGNHDYDHTPGRLTYMNEFFKLEDVKKSPTFGDVYEPGKLENHYQFVEIHGRKWIVLSLEMGPRRAVIDWANKVLKEHKGRLAIILTHGYLYYNNERYNHLRGGQRASPYNFYGEGADGEMLWNRLVRKHPNVMMVICGHLSSAYVGYRKDEGDYGNIVHQMLVDYEKMKGGQGFLRLLEFLPDSETVQVRTYSPVTKGTNPRNPKLEEFTLKLELADRATPRPAAGATAAPLSKQPVHRYSFGGAGGDGAKVHDAVGSAHGVLKAGGGKSALDGKGRLILTGGGHVALPGKLLAGLKDVSFELWFAPTADSYKWQSAVRFGSRDDWLVYTFRTLTVHRAEIAVNRHNEDIQRSVPVKPGTRMHVVVTYDHDGADGKAVLRYYRDGKCHGTMPTKLRLGDVEEAANTVGPFPGVFDELRLYDYPLTAPEIRGNFNAGPDKLTSSESQANRRSIP